MSKQVIQNWKAEFKKEHDKAYRLKLFFGYASGSPGLLNIKEIKSLHVKAVNRARYYDKMLKDYSKKT